MSSYLPSLEDLSNLHSVLELISKVGSFLSRGGSLLPRRRQEGGRTEAVIESALKDTLREWEKVAVLAEPRIADQLANVGELEIHERARLLEAVALRFSGDEHISLEKLVSIPLVHSEVEITSDGILVHFGKSSQTRLLAGENLLLPSRLLPLKVSSRYSGENMNLPSFRVTMLGDSGSGKTVFMSSMYARLREGHRGIAIKAIDDAVDLELGEHMERLYQFNKWPPGTELSQLKYDFELQIGGKPIANINWVDYRGGALFEDPDSEGGKALSQRLRGSHAIIWMIDMTKLNSAKIDGMRERIQTRVARMSAICRNAVQADDQPRAWIFVRTKADTVVGHDGMPDWNKASSDLIQHLGPTVGSIMSLNNSRAAALPISSVGRCSGVGGEILGDDPSFVEWPLLLSLAFLMQSELERLRHAHSWAQREVNAWRPGSVEAFMREFLRLGPREEEMQAVGKLSEVSRKLLGVHHIVGALLRDCPAAVKVVTDNPAYR